MNHKIIHPFLIAVFPILFLFSQNVLVLNVSETAIPIIINLVVTFFLLILVNLIIKDKLKTALIVTVVILLFFSYGHLLNLAIYLDYSIGDNYDMLVFPILILLFGVILVFTYKTKKNLIKFNYFLNTVFGLLVSFQILSAGCAIVLNPESEEITSRLTTSSVAPSNLPDIYYIILDGYGRQDVLNEIYKYDNSDFIHDLRSRGFYVADSSHSNYCTTTHSVTSALNLDYLHNLIDIDYNTFGSGPLSSLVSNNRVFNFLKKFGYKTVAFATGYAFTELDSTDHYFSPRITVSEFENFLLNYTPIPFFVKNRKNQFDLHRDKINFIFDKLGDLKQIEGPKIVFAPILSPHPPFVFDQDGGNIQRNWPFSYADGDHFNNQGGKASKYIIGYRNQAKYISKRVITTIDRILENSGENQPIIIIQGDHGPGMGLRWETASKSDMHERFSILNAYYLPHYDGRDIYRSITPINSFRVIFNNYFGATLKLIPEFNYYTKYTKPYQYIDVTDHLRTIEEKIANKNNEWFSDLHK
ncbi:MAG: hypothetical protein GY865_05255 [candidate division Zixibacteria bacterium]|nr:hypothetical protein [candidate division Zixibacteria bacterium]